MRDFEDARAAARSLLEEGPRNVVITLGEQGAWLCSPEEESAISAFPVQSRDTTGAGDAFVGSFAVFLAQDTPPREALAKASLYAALSTRGVGTQKSFPSRDELEREWSRRASRE